VLFTNRNSRRSLLIEVNPYQILVAGIDRPEGGPATIHCAAEFETHDDAGLRSWLAANFEKPNTWVPAIAGFVPPEALLQRESLVPRKLVEPSYLAELIRDQYKIEHPENWKLQTLSPLEGELVPAEGTQRPALVCGVSHTDVHFMQQRLLDQRLLPYRLEFGVLPLLGAVIDHQERQNEKRAVVVVVIEAEHTTAYIIGKEGVHTPAPVRHGFSSIVQAARREFDLTHAGEVRERLHHADDELLLRASKFVRAIGRDLKPLVDSYEMTTGQPVGEIFCAYLPPSLSWISEPLAHVIGRTPFTLDCTAWQAGVNIVLANDVNPLGQHWLGALSLIARLPGASADKAAKPDAVYQGPWRVDNRISTALPSGDLVRRRFIANAIAGTLAAGTLIVAAWQFYVSNTLRADISFWSQRIRENQQQVEELNVLTKKLADQTSRLDQAHTLMTAPYTLSELVVGFGRTRLDKMTIETIQGFPGGVALRGTLQEPAEQASQTLRNYVNTLRKDPDISTKFGVIALISMERSEGADGVRFEIACKLKEAKP
jgi:hypothetical protein